jgi:hypothetical protein
MGPDRLIELASLVKANGAVKLLIGQVLEGQSAYELAIWLKDFGGQSQSNVRGRAEITARINLSSG